MRLKRPSLGIVIFFVVIINLTVWIASGVILREPPPDRDIEDPAPVSVAVEHSRAEPIERLLRLYGNVQPNQVVLVRAETSGRVAEVLTSRGARVSPGDDLMQLDLGDRPARLRRAEAQLADAARNYEAVRQLVEEEITAEIELRRAEAELEEARAGLEDIQQEIEHTRLRAPIESFVNRLIAETGDFVSLGEQAVELVDNDPLLAVVDVPQHAIWRVRPGSSARVMLTGAEPVSGEVTFVAPLADPETRTFRTHIEIPNPDGELPAGVSAEVVIPTETVSAHCVSPAHVTLNDEGQVGVFTVDEEDIIQFHPIEFVRAEADGVWVTGLPEEIRLITVRPGLVSAGQKVDPNEQTEASREDE